MATSNEPPRPKGRKGVSTHYIAQLSPRERILRDVSVNAATGCWDWVGYIRPTGYGQLTIAGISSSAYRVSYEAFVGPIPKGLHIDHLCRNTRCVNPEHLEPVTPAVNNQRSGAAKTHCPHGHEYAGENLYVYKGRRMCRECSRQDKRRRRARERAAL